MPRQLLLTHKLFIEQGTLFCHSQIAMYTARGNQMSIRCRLSPLFIKYLIAPEQMYAWTIDKWHPRKGLGICDLQLSPAFSRFCNNGAAMHLFST